MNNKLFYEIENEYMTLKNNLLDSFNCDYDKNENHITIKEFLDIGFNNSYISFDKFGKRFNLGYKFENKYCSEDFSLNEEQLNCKIGDKIESDIDSEGYTIIYITLENESDKKYFVKEGECL